MTVNYDEIEWFHFGGNDTSVPSSTCSDPCAPRQYFIVKELECCWECYECRNNEIVIDNNTACEVRILIHLSLNDSNRTLTWVHTPHAITMCASSSIILFTYQYPYERSILQNLFCKQTSPPYTRTKFMYKKIGFLSRRKWRQRKIRQDCPSLKVHESRVFQFHIG